MQAKPGDHDHDEEPERQRGSLEYLKIKSPFYQVQKDCQQVHDIQNKTTKKSRYYMCSTGNSLRVQTTNDPADFFFLTFLRELSPRISTGTCVHIHVFSIHVLQQCSPQSVWLVFGTTTNSPNVPPATHQHRSLHHHPPPGLGTHPTLPS